MLFSNRSSPPVIVYGDWWHKPHLLKDNFGILYTLFDIINYNGDAYPTTAYYAL